MPARGRDSIYSRCFAAEARQSRVRRPPLNIWIRAPTALRQPASTHRHARRRLLESEELAQRIADLLSDRQAEDIVLMDIGKVSSFTDYFVVATVGNPRQMNALIESLQTD